jgi:uracil phosphoribosyltransferase
MSHSSPFGPMKGRDQPDRVDVLGSERLVVLHHPLASNLMTTLRDIHTSPVQFEVAIHELTRHLLWKATERELTEQVQVTSFTGESVFGTRFARKQAALIILRAGLSMLAPFRTLVPGAPVYQVGIKRDEATLEPHLYYANLPDHVADLEHVLILDPMLATGGSAGLALRELRTRFSGDVSVVGLIGAPIGAKNLLDADPTLRLFLGSLDDRLNDLGYIVPGLGDAGDRLFGTN